MNTVPFVPWYRHPWLWFVIAIPTVAVSLSLCFVYLAVVNRDTVVRDDWYEDGKTINNSFTRDEAALKLGLAAHHRRGIAEAGLKGSGGSTEH